MVQSSAIDSITASVVQGALENIAVEMGYKLMRMSYSSIIRGGRCRGARAGRVGTIDAARIGTDPRLLSAGS
jgi:hypothetical protein